MAQALKDTAGLATVGRVISDDEVDADSYTYPYCSYLEELLKQADGDQSDACGQEEEEEEEEDPEYTRLMAELKASFK